MGPLNGDGGTTACFHYVFEKNFKNLEGMINIMLKDCFINMEKHKVKTIKSVFIYKTIYWTTNQ